MTTNKISLNDLKHGIIRIPKDIRPMFPDAGKRTVIINGTPANVHRCRDMITGLGKLYTLASLTGETTATWGTFGDTPMLTFCAGDGVPAVDEVSDTYTCADGTTVPATVPLADVNLDTLKRDELRVIAKERGIKGFGKMSPDELREAIRRTVPMFNMGVSPDIGGDL